MKIVGNVRLYLECHERDQIPVQSTLLLQLNFDGDYHLQILTSPQQSDLNNVTAETFDRYPGKSTVIFECNQTKVVVTCKSNPCAQICLGVNTT